MITGMSEGKNYRFVVMARSRIAEHPVYAKMWREVEGRDADVVMMDLIERDKDKIEREKVKLGSITLSTAYLMDEKGAVQTKYSFPRE